jgi:hypothetical protein
MTSLTDIFVTSECFAFLDFNCSEVLLVLSGITDGRVNIVNNYNREEALS